MKKLLYLIIVVLHLAYPDSILSQELIPANIRIDATFENIGINYSISGDENLNSSLQLNYRIQGSSNWKSGAMSRRAHPGLVIDGAPTSFNFHAASAMYLQANTTYEIQLILNDPDGGSTTSVVQATTKAFPQPSINTIKYVTPGNGGGDGTIANPYRGLQIAADNASPGDHFVVRSGVYQPFVLIESGTQSAPISFVSESSQCAIIDGNDTDRHIIQLGDFSTIVSHIIIDGFTIQNGNWGIDAQNTQHVTIKNNLLQDVNFGYYNRRELGNEHDQYITNNVFSGRTDWPGTGIPKERAIDIRGNNNVISYNSIENFGDGISTDGPPHFLNYSIDIHNNDVKNAVDDLIEIDHLVSNGRVYANRLYNGRAGISLAPIMGGPAYIVRNEIYNLEYSGFKMNRGPSGLVIVNNTVVSSGSTLSSTVGWQNTFYRNNVIFSDRYCFEEFGLVEESNDDWDFGAFYSSRSGLAGNEWFKWSDVRYADLTDLQMNSGIQAEAISVVPSDFENIQIPANWNVEYNPSQRDLSPVNNSPLINSGVQLSNLNDPFNIGLPDRGALEFGAPSPQYGVASDLICGNIVLPLELLSFDVSNTDGNVLIRWTTVNEENIDHFIIERKFESDLSFESITEVQAKGSIVNMASYRIDDQLPDISGKYYYRLKIVDHESNHSYSQIESVNIIRSNEDGIILFPNPTFEEVYLNGLQNSDDLTINVYDRIGQLVARNYEYKNGLIKIDLSNLNSGVYIVELRQGLRQSHYKLIKQ